MSGNGMPYHLKPGNILKASRESQALHLDNAAAFLGISERYLAVIEHDKYDVRDLEKRAQIKKHIQNYAKYLAFSGEQIQDILSLYDDCCSQIESQAHENIRMQPSKRFLSTRFAVFVLLCLSLGSVSMWLNARNNLISNLRLASTQMEHTIQEEDVSFSTVEEVIQDIVMKELQAEEADRYRGDAKTHLT